MESAPQLLLQMYILAVKVSTATNSSTNQHDENSTATNNTELNGNYSLSTAAVNSSTDLQSDSDNLINLINILTANDERNSYSIILNLTKFSQFHKVYLLCFLKYNLLSTIDCVGWCSSADTIHPHFAGQSVAGFDSFFQDDNKKIAPNHL